MDANPKVGLELVVAGLARDCAFSLQGTLVFCEELELLVPDTRFVFVENSSTDGTREILEEWCSRYPNRYLTHPIGVDRENSRTVRIAACRNVYKEFINSRFENTQYTLFLDMDLGLVREDALAAHRAIEFIARQPDISAVFPNSTPLYYDLFALRHPIWCPNDVWQDVDEAWREWRTDDNHQTSPEDLFVRSRQILIPADLPPIKVDSAFGGLGLYRWDLARDGDYRGVDKEGNPTCEHVEFHKSISGDKYILPSWRINAPREHLSSAFRTEFPHERELRRRRSRIAIRESLIRKLPMLDAVLRWAIR